MLKQIRNGFLFLWMLGILIPLGAQAKTVSLKDFVTRYVEGSSTLRQEKKTTEKTQAALKTARGNEDFELSLSGGYTYEKDVQQSSVTYAQGHEYGIQASLNKTVTSTGTRITVSHSMGYTQAKDGSSTLSPSSAIPDSTVYSATSALSLIQPLLKNFFGRQDRYPKENALLDAEIQKVQEAETAENERVKAVTAYLDWIYYRRQLQIIQNVIDHNRTVLKDVEAKVKSGVADVSDLETARQELISYEASLLSTRNAFQQWKRELALNLSLPEEDEPDTSILDSRYVLPQGGISGIRPVRVLALTQKQMELLLGIKKDSLLPELNAVLSLQTLGTGEDARKSYENMKGSEIYLGFTFALPLGNWASQGAYEESLADYQKFMEQKNESEKTYANQNQNLRESVVLYGGLVDSQKDYVKSLEKGYEAQQRQYRQGILSLQELMRTANSLASARLKLTEYLGGYQLTYYQYLAFLDQLN